MVGDVMMGRNIKEISERYGPTYVFRYTLPYFENSDYVSGNFENPVLLKTKDQYEKAEKYIHLETQRQAVVTTKEAGFTILNLANNHMMDYGEKGLRDTLQVFKEENLDYIGAGKNLTDAKNIVYQDLKEDGYNVIYKDSPVFYGGVQALVRDEKMNGAGDGRLNGSWKSN